MELVVISRDPFARVDFIRRPVVVYNDTTCAFCGAPGRKVKEGRRYFQYGHVEDSLIRRPYFDKHLFCGVKCYREYHT